MVNRHHVYPVSTDGIVHEGAYVAATSDGQTTVAALCGATTFHVTSDGRIPTCEACLEANQWGPRAKVAPAPPRPQCAACGQRGALIEGICASCTAKGYSAPRMF